MTLFDDRERAFELKYIHDLEMQFRATVLGTRLIAEWAARQMDLPGDETEAYIRDNVMALLNRLDETQLIDRLSADMAARGIAVDGKQLRNMMAGFSAQAMERLGGYPPLDEVVPTRPH